jgi:hypothetical protein
MFEGENRWIWGSHSGAHEEFCYVEHNGESGRRNVRQTRNQREAGSKQSDMLARSVGLLSPEYGRRTEREYYSIKRSPHTQAFSFLLDCNNQMADARTSYVGATLVSLPQ